MIDKPKTMMLTPHEWRALVFTGSHNLMQYVNTLTTEAPPSREQIEWFHDALDRLKMQVSAWGASGQPAAAAPEQPETTGNIDQVQNGGGAAAAAEPKKKRGWQKGRKRGPRKPKGTEAVQ
jgi:hypothetical protein